MNTKPINEEGSYNLMLFYNRACLYARDFKQLYDTINKASKAAGLLDVHMDIVMHFARMKSKLLAGVK